MNTLSDITPASPLALPESFSKFHQQNASLRPPRTHRRRRAISVKAVDETTSPSTATEIRVCTNRPCVRQGSMETLQTLLGIAPPNVTVKACGCLGKCGSGPNLVALPGATRVGHCSTAARAAETMALVCGGGSESWSNSLAALALRKRAQEELDKGNASEAEVLLSQAIDLRPSGGIHVLHKDRSSARLMNGKIVEALDDANTAVNLAPKYSEAYLCQGDAFMAMNQFDAAEKSYAVAVELDPSTRRSKSFKTRIAKLQEKLISAELP